MFADENAADDSPDALDIPSSPHQPVTCSFITGEAGTGKSYQLRERAAAENVLLCSSTGISAVNLGVTTLNAVIGYFDTASLEDQFVTGRLERRFRQLIDQGERELAIDEISMVPGEQFDLIYNAVEAANSAVDEGERLRITVCGDFAQLPPVKGRWAFEADCWKHFAAGTTKLTKVWRQTSPDFLTALNLIRRGDGPAGAAALAKLTKFAVNIDAGFDGTTIVPLNKEVVRINKLRFARLPGTIRQYEPRFWGKQKAEWRKLDNPLQLKPGALARIMANGGGKTSAGFEYANGDTGHVVDMDDLTVSIKLKRNDQVVTVREVLRKNEVRELADGENGQWDEKTERYVVGGVKYMPVKLAFACTCHSSQGLTLDKVQIDMRENFFGSSNLAYVALSRCKSVEGMRIIGSEPLLAKRINVDPKVLPYV